jgi:RNA polymerase sigma-70 factor (ECF subfamily)
VRLLRALGLYGGGDTGVEVIAAPHATAAIHADVATVVQLVGRLTSDERIAWSLRYLEGESLEEVAEHCRCSLATAKRRILAANTFIHTQLGDAPGVTP